MEIVEAVRKVLSEVVLPDLNQIQHDNAEIKSGLSHIHTRMDDVGKRMDDFNKRLDDTNTHLADQSRRIDALRSELSENIATVRSELAENIVAVRTELSHRIDETNRQQHETNLRLDRLFEIIVRREEFSETVMKVLTLEREINDIKRTIAAA